MNNVNQTLYIPLYGKAYVSRKGLFLSDKKAEEIWAAEGFPLKGKSKSRWLAYYMGIRSAVFDRWLKRQLMEQENGVVLHVGCGMDSRVLRVGTMGHLWYDVDFPEVISERRRYYEETESYHMISGDVRKPDWLNVLPQDKTAIVVMEGVSMYLSNEELKAFFRALSEQFSQVVLLMDCYSVFAAKMSRYRNPVNDVGVTTVYGMDEPTMPENERLSFVKEWDMTPECFINELTGMERSIFRKLYAGGFAKKLYRLYEYGRK